MKEFRTELTLPKATARMDLKSGILTQGSCFSEAIGHRFKIYKMNASVNPFGVIYNPVSIHKVLTYSLFNEPLPDHTFLQHHDIHYNFNFHSEFSDLQKPALISRLADTVETNHFFLKDAEWLLITYGTAWVYERKDTGEIVANCHKMPADLFTKSLLRHEDIFSSFSTFFHSLKRLNPKIRIILTVSPVRHVKDTLELNSVSKAVLRLACHSMAGNFNGVEYFPAFEIMMDDLRDYRFYKPDMLHPTEEAEDYIWEKFLARYADDDTLEFMTKWKGILSALSHRAFHPESTSHQQFLRHILKKLGELKSSVDVEEEELRIKNQML